MKLHCSLISTCKWQLRSAWDTRNNISRMRHTPDRPKVFCIGLNKTGTTSWTQAMGQLGYVVGSETKATMFFDDWLKGDFSQIIKYCRHEGEAFQDIPFSLPGTFQEMDRAFPRSKFVLTVRNSAEEWYRSMIYFHSKLCSSAGTVPPTPDELAVTTYWRRGFYADYCREVLQTPIDDPYNKERALAFYRSHNKKVQEYFAERTDDFIVINVAKKGEYNRLKQFLGIPTSNEELPWVNKT